MMQKALIFLFSIFFTAESKDLGVFGETFVIAERDLLERLQLKLRKLEESGGLEEEKGKVERRVKEMILHPQPISGITHTQKIREYQFDPTITVTRDLSDHRGQVFAKKGEQFNPLDRISFLKPLLFIDGGDEKQVQWAVSKLKDENIHGHEFSKIILVKGSPLDLQGDLKEQKPLGYPVYFDQHGVLTTKLGIKHVPAIVFQRLGEKVLTIIEEVVSTGGD